MLIVSVILIPLAVSGMLWLLVRVEDNLDRTILEQSAATRQDSPKLMR